MALAASQNKTLTPEEQVEIHRGMELLKRAKKALDVALGPDSGPDNNSDSEDNDEEALGVAKFQKAISLSNSELGKEFNNLFINNRGLADAINSQYLAMRNRVRAAHVEDEDEEEDDDDEEEEIDEYEEDDNDDDDDDDEEDDNDNMVIDGGHNALAPDAASTSANHFVGQQAPPAFFQMPTARLPPLQGSVQGPFFSQPVTFGPTVATASTRATRSTPGRAKGPNGANLPEEVDHPTVKYYLYCQEAGCTRKRKQRRMMRRHYKEDHNLTQQDFDNLGMFHEPERP